MSPSQLPRNFAQAIDLSALAAPKVAPSGKVGIEVNAANLVKEVLPASNSKVVILLAYSPRSPQSQSILNILAKFASDDTSPDGTPAWILGAVNVDAEPSVAAALQVQSVPLALAILQEQVVPLFESVPSESQVRAVLDKVLALAGERGLAVAQTDTKTGQEPAGEPEELAALAALEAGDFLAAKAAYEAWLRRSPFEPLAKLGLAQTELFIRTQGLDRDDVVSRSKNEPENLDLQMLASDLDLLYGETQQSFDRLINLVRITSGDDRMKIKDHLINLFSLIDPQDSVLIKSRQQLASALF